MPVFDQEHTFETASAVMTFPQTAPEAALSYAHPTCRKVSARFPGTRPLTILDHLVYSCLSQQGAIRRPLSSV